jgi:hypothetical protein
MAQPPGLPERMIAADPDASFGHFLDLWTNDPRAVPADVRAARLKACREAVPSLVADHRASAGIDIEHDQVDRAAGNQLDMPVTVLQQGWGTALGFDAVALWRPGPRNTSTDPEPYAVDQQPPSPHGRPPRPGALRQQRFQHCPLLVREISSTHEP